MSLLFSALVALLLQLNPSVVWKAPHVGTELEVTATDRVSPDGKPVEEYTPSEYKGAEVVTGTYVLRQELQLSGSGKLKVEGNVVWSACSGDYCQMPEEYSFSVPVEMPGQRPGMTVAPVRHCRPRPAICGALSWRPSCGASSCS